MHTLITKSRAKPITDTRYVPGTLLSIAIALIAVPRITGDRN